MTNSDARSEYSVSIYAQSDAASVMNAVNYVNGRRSSKISEAFQKWTQKSVAISGEKAKTMHSQKLPDNWVLGKDFNLVVESIAPNTPAASTELRVGDHIVSIDGLSNFNTENSLRSHLQFSGSSSRKSGQVLLVVRDSDVTIDQEGQNQLAHALEILKLDSEAKVKLPDGIRIIFLEMAKGIAWGETRTWLGAKLAWVPVQEFSGMNRPFIPTRRTTY